MKVTFIFDSGDISVTMPWDCPFLPTQGDLVDGTLFRDIPEIERTRINKLIDADCNMVQFVDWQKDMYDRIVPIVYVNVGSEHYQKGN